RWLIHFQNLTHHSMILLYKDNTNLIIFTETAFSLSVENDDKIGSLSDEFGSFVQTENCNFAK
ncbi:MAG: hypothetical protein K2N96_02140, partial [Muribaculaceae bacterium]|nr:hypothetical protein [Muribaculaceae bacterium]